MSVSKTVEKGTKNLTKVAKNAWSKTVAIVPHLRGYAIYAWQASSNKMRIVWILAEMVIEQMETIVKIVPWIIANSVIQINLFAIFVLPENI
jgi:hypothetical protein